MEQCENELTSRSTNLTVSGKLFSESTRTADQGWKKQLFFKLEICFFLFFCFFMVFMVFWFLGLSLESQK